MLAIYKIHPYLFNILHYQNEIIKEQQVNRPPPFQQWKCFFQNDKIDPKPKNLFNPTYLGSCLSPIEISCGTTDWYEIFSNSITKLILEGKVYLFYCCINLFWFGVNLSNPENPISIFVPVLFVREKLNVQLFKSSFEGSKLMQFSVHLESTCRYILHHILHQICKSHGFLVGN